jgi:hypothetical protein
MPTPMQLAEQARKNAEARKKVGNKYKETRANKYRENYVKPVQATKKIERMLKNERLRLRRELNEKIRREANQRRRNENMKKEAERIRIENERRRLEQESITKANENNKLKQIYVKALKTFNLELNNNNKSGFRFKHKNPAKVLNTNRLLSKKILLQLHSNKVPLENRNLYDEAFKKYEPFLKSLRK